MGQRVIINSATVREHLIFSERFSVACGATSNRSAINRRATEQRPQKGASRLEPALCCSLDIDVRAMCGISILHANENCYWPVPMGSESFLLVQQSFRHISKRLEGGLPQENS